MCAQLELHLTMKGLQKELEGKKDGKTNLKLSLVDYIKVRFQHYQYEWNT